MDERVQRWWLEESSLVLFELQAVTILLFSLRALEMKSPCHWQGTSALRSAQCCYTNGFHDIIWIRMTFLLRKRRSSYVWRASWTLSETEFGPPQQIGPRFHIRSKYFGSLTAFILAINTSKPLQPHPQIHQIWKFIKCSNQMSVLCNIHGSCAKLRWPLLSVGLANEDFNFLPPLKSFGST